MISILKSFLVLGCSPVLEISFQNVSSEDTLSGFYYTQNEPSPSHSHSPSNTGHYILLIYLRNLSLISSLWSFQWSYYLALLQSLPGLSSHFSLLLQPPHKTDLIHQSPILESFTGSSLPVKNNKKFLYNLTCKNISSMLLTRKQLQINRYRIL